jgi:hypothetical protein
MSSHYDGPDARDFAADRIADLLPRAEARADWRPVRALYDQMITVADNLDRSIPVELAEAFADAVATANLSYAAEEAQFCRHALAILADVDGHEEINPKLYEKYYTDERFLPVVTVGGRRRARPFEAIVETCRRRRDARSLRAACRGSRTSGLLIGSASYGGFFNVRGFSPEQPASDLDFIIVDESAAALDQIATALAALPGIASQDIDSFRRRARIFAQSCDEGTTVFSHKVRLWADDGADALLPGPAAYSGYLLSMHVMSKAVLNYALVGSTPRLLRETAGARRTLKDFREAPAGRWDDLYDFAGRQHRSSLESVAVEGGFLRLPKVYYIDALDCYFPGFYQTMLFPEPDLLWDELDVRPAIEEFQRKLTERIRFEAHRRDHTMLRPSFAHVRRDVFAPGVIRRLDAGYGRS